MAADSALPSLTTPMRAQPLPDTFDERYLAHDFLPAVRMVGVGQWTLERARAARDTHMLGDYRQSALLAEASKTDPAVFSALFNRLAPHRGLPIEMTGERVRIVAEAKALAPRAAEPGVVADGFEWLAQLGEAVDYVTWIPRADGSRVDPIVRPWPMRSLYRTPITGGRLFALTTEGLIEVVHGDGKWIVWSGGASEPWQWGAVKAIAETWVDRRLGVRDRSQNAEAHGMAKPMAELPEDCPLDSDEAKAVKKLVVDLRNARSGGTVPHGTIVKLLESMGAGWQIFRELINGDSTDIARVYLGSESSMVGEGGNYIKAAQLFGVRNDIVERDLGIGADALTTGLWRPWGLRNFAVDNAVKVRWLFPDPDEDARRESLAKRTDAFNKAIWDYRANGFKLSQTFVDRLAERFGVDTLQLGEPPAPATGAQPKQPPQPSNGPPSPAA